MRKAYKTVACLLAGTVLLTGAGLPNKVQAAGIETNEFAYLAGSPVENSLESKISASQEITLLLTMRQFQMLKTTQRLKQPQMITVKWLENCITSHW